MGGFTFTKEERLSKEKLIQELFKKGSSFNLYPFRVIHRIHPEQDGKPHQVLISVSVKNFKKAVDRNLLKRRIREHYRVEKILPQPEQRLMIAYIYTAKAIEDSNKIRHSIVKTGEMLLRESGRKKREP